MKKIKKSFLIICSVLVSSWRNISGLYSFANDGGAVGSVGLGVIVPKNSDIKSFWVKPLVAFTSGGAATISYTLVGTTSGTVLATLFTPTGFAAFTPNILIAGVDFDANPFGVITEDAEVTMNIGTAAITAGDMRCTLDYTENSL